MVRLRRSRPDSPGFTRRRRGRGWDYRDFDGTQITDPETLDRIKALVIPPAWQHVWISPWPNGHIQATGIDAAGRKQYLYHLDWSTRRHTQKFERVVGFGAALPRARKVVASHLEDRDFSKERVLATAFRLLDRGHFRIGGEVYAETNGSFGLATIRREQVRREKRELVFDYTAKSGLHRVERIADPQLLEIVGGLLRRRGDIEIPELLAYRVGRTWHRITSAEINRYLKEVTRQNISAKDFRTWHGTTMAAVALTQVPQELKSRAAVARAERQAVVAVSEQLGNTPAVCRASYIDPRVIDAFERNQRITTAVNSAMRSLGAALPKAVDEQTLGTVLTMVAATPQVERAVLRLLKS
jgi:DNA topoisomerase-1